MDIRQAVKNTLKDYTLLALKDVLNIDSIRTYDEYTNIIKISIYNGIDIRILHLDTNYSIKISRGRKELESIEFNSYDQTKLLSVDAIKELLLEERIARHI
jgi:hypothetical protein